MSGYCIGILICVATAVTMETYISFPKIKDKLTFFQIDTIEFNIYSPGCDIIVIFNGPNYFRLLDWGMFPSYYISMQEYHKLSLFSLKLSCSYGTSIVVYNVVIL